MNKYLKTYFFALSMGANCSLASTSQTTLKLETIDKMTSACFDLARKKKYTVAIAIYDQGGILVGFSQMDGASPAVGEVARWKALSAAYYRVATSETAKWDVPTAPKIATVRGGMPIFTQSGIPLGGVGVSGAPSEFDEDCSAAAIKAVALNLKG